MKNTTYLGKLLEFVVLWFKEEFGEKKSYWKNQQDFQEQISSLFIIMKYFPKTLNSTSHTSDTSFFLSKPHTR